MELDPWAAVSNATRALTSAVQADPKRVQLEAAKKALMLLQSDDSGVFIELCLSAANGDSAGVMEIISKPENLKLLSEQDNSGLSPLVYAVVFDQEAATELLLSKSTAALNEPDGLFGYTPLMWAVYLDNKEIVVELLNHGAGLDVQGKNGLTVLDLLKPGSEMYDFFEQHGLLDQKTKTSANGNSDGAGSNGLDFYNDNSVRLMESSRGDDELLDKIRLQTAGLSVASDDTAGMYQDSTEFIQSNVLLGESFNFTKLLKNQFIIFSDYDISAILDLIFKLNTDYNHKTTYPAAVIYQCVRYADHMKQNDVLVENFLNLAFTRIRSGTSSKSGVTSVYSEGDIVLQSYWLSVVNFLFFYLSKDDGFFKRYPRVLQDLVNTLNSLIIELSNSIKFRLNSMVDDCLLNYTSIPDISSTLYKNDWNFFKKKHQEKSTYDEIFQMLYPPSVKDQLKPSPIRVIQTFGALLYVLDLHNIHPVITQQTLSNVFHWLSSTIFNRIISQKRHLSRVRAIQMRLNISVLEDWARSNNKMPKIPELDSYLLKLFPYTLIEDHLTEDHVLTIHNVAFFGGDKLNPNDAEFYHLPLFAILKQHFEPTFELLQWLQCLSSLPDEEGFDMIAQDLKTLNFAQLWKCVEKYRYEVDEVKLTKHVKRAIEKRGKSDVKKVANVRYLDENLVLLNQDYNFPVAIPTIPAMIDQYGAGLGGIHKERAHEFEPFLPYQVVDAIDEIHEQQTTQREEADQEDVERINEGFEQNIIGVDDVNSTNGDALTTGETTTEHKDTGLFAELQLPSTLAHRSWGGDDENEINLW